MFVCVRASVCVPVRVCAQARMHPGGGGGVASVSQISWKEAAVGSPAGLDQGSGDESGGREPIWVLFKNKVIRACGWFGSEQRWGLVFRMTSRSQDPLSIPGED